MKYETLPYFVPSGSVNDLLHAEDEGWKFQIATLDDGEINVQCSMYTEDMSDGIELRTLRYRWESEEQAKQAILDIREIWLLGVDAFYRKSGEEGGRAK